MISPFAGVLGSLTKELHTLSTAISSSERFSSSEVPCSALSIDFSRKRRRRAYDTSAEPQQEYDTSLGVASTDGTLEDLTEHVVDAYFRCIHPWISIIHEPSFRNEVQEPVGAQRMGTIVKAMAVAALRFVKQSDLRLNHDSFKEKVTGARREVLYAVMENMGVESVQALLILIFSDIADDRTVMAHSLLGIAWRYIKSLELHLERPPHDKCTAIFGTTHKSLTTADWIETEERRRIFWNAFMLDRLCTALLGQKPTSLGISIGPRLPVCGSFWYTNQPRTTPALLLSDPSKAGLTALVTPLESPITSGMGSLAFYIETMESMSIVISHFLSLEVDYTSKQDVSRWLMRFKELDQYLMQ
jgi:hypothetical protein